MVSNLLGTNSTICRNLVKMNVKYCSDLKHVSAQCFRSNYFMLGTLRRDSLINKVSSVFQNDNVNDGEEFFICFGKSIGYSF